MTAGVFAAWGIMELMGHRRLRKALSQLADDRRDYD